MSFGTVSIDEPWYGEEGERESNTNLGIIFLIYKAEVNEQEKEPVTYEVAGYLKNATKAEAQKACDEIGEVKVFGQTYKGAYFKQLRQYGREYYTTTN